MPVTTIDPEDGTVSMANFFTVEPEHQDALAAALAEGAEKAIRHRPGCVSVNILKSLDHKRVLYIAQWRSTADIKATLDDPEVQKYRDQAAALGTPDPHAVIVHSVHYPEVVAAGA
jgi:quinol monooxygenase YgiN